ncbi:non-specific serine/threonine protein kinase [Malassezia sp. CBS 17886]|nr:non-specific serine/threonine protein kinase [Malassezia sp. CBS 17886]
MQADDVIWSVIGHQFCSYKIKSTTHSTFCRNEYNLTGMCNRQSCPLANSRYATVREKDGIVYLYVKTTERAHAPRRQWERIRLSNRYSTALEQIDKELAYWPNFITHKAKQRLTKITQYLIKMRKIRLKAEEQPELVGIKKKTERREATRENKALRAAKIEKSIEKELLDRLKRGAYGDAPLNVNEDVWNTVLERAQARVPDADADDLALEEELSDEEAEEDIEEMDRALRDADDGGDYGQREFVSDDEDSEDDMEELDPADWDTDEGSEGAEDESGEEDEGGDDDDDAPASSRKRKLPARKPAPKRPTKRDPRSRPRLEVEYEHETEPLTAEQATECGALSESASSSSGDSDWCNTSSSDVYGDGDATPPVASQRAPDAASPNAVPPCFGRWMSLRSRAQHSTAQRCRTSAKVARFAPVDGDDDSGAEASPSPPQRNRRCAQRSTGLERHFENVHMDMLEMPWSSHMDAGETTASLASDTPAWLDTSSSELSSAQEDTVTSSSDAGAFRYKRAGYPSPRMPSALDAASGRRMRTRSISGSGDHSESLLLLCEQQQVQFPTDATKAVLVDLLLQAGMASGGHDADAAVNAASAPLDNAEAVVHADQPHSTRAEGDAGGHPPAEQAEAEELNGLDLEQLGLLDREIPPDKLEKLEKIGSGAFKDVYVGKYKISRTRVHKVAIADLRDQLTDMDIKEITFLRDLRHENIVRFIGVSLPPDPRPVPCMIVSELCSNGDLFDYIRNTAPPPDVQIFRILLQIARGLAYLHTRAPTVIHRDCKSSNVLITKQGMAKISDFGLARVKRSSRAMIRSLVGTVNWQAVELWAPKPNYNEKADVWSAAMTFWEALQWHQPEKRYPFQGMNEHQIYLNVGQKQQRPFVGGIRRRYGDDIVDLLDRMWAHAPRNRPTMMQAFLQTIENRRTFYHLSKRQILSDEKVVHLVQNAVRQAPSPFNVQSSRVVVLYGDQHDRYWGQIVPNALRAVAGEEALTSSKERLAGFAAAAGTVLFFEDRKLIEGQQEQYPSYATEFPKWSDQSSGMAQIYTWTLLEAEGYGASLQHYGNLTEGELKKLYQLPDSYAIKSELVFGHKEANTTEKSFVPDHERVLVFQ